MAFDNFDPYDPYGVMAPEPDPNPAPAPPPPPAPGGPGGPPPPAADDFFHLPPGYMQFGSYEGPTGTFAIPDAPQFQAPTFDDAMNSPGYQFRLNQGLGALQRSAAARGLLRTGGTLKDVNDYAQGSASQEYGNVFDRALQGYGTKFNAWKTQTGFEGDRALHDAQIQYSAWNARESARRRAIELLASIGSGIYLNNQNEDRNEPLPY